MEQINQDLKSAIRNFYIAIPQINKEITNILRQIKLKSGQVLSFEQITALSIIHSNESITINELAEEQKIFKTAASKRIKKLEECGYVQIFPTDDKRLKAVCLTLEGELLLEEATVALTHSIKQCLDCCKTEQEFEEFVEQLIYFKKLFI